MNKFLPYWTEMILILPMNFVLLFLLALIILPGKHPCFCGGGGGGGGGSGCGCGGGGDGSGGGESLYIFLFVIVFPLMVN